NINKLSIILRSKVKSRIASGKILTKIGTFTTRSDVNAEESELFGVTREGLQNYALKALEWYQGADRDLKFFFNNGNSRTNLWKKRKAQEQLQQEAKQMRTLEEMWGIKICNRKEVPLILYYDEYEECEDTIIQSQQLIENRYNELKHKLHGLQNAKKEMASLQSYEVQRLTSVCQYFRLLLDSEKKMKASNQVANIFWKDIRNIDYMSRCVRGWAKDFLVQGSLSSHQQGKHSKKLSLLSDEDISLAARFHKRAVEQQVYFDGHEREDVQEYRKSWAPRMINYRKKMDQYCGDEMEIVIPPERLEIWDSRYVMVTHDEVYFYANDDMSYVWLEDSESVIKKKGQGGSIMVSDFLCPCHGPLRLTEEDSI
ncbi:90_t:CDS:2, partial [Scutellospora calospora]